MFLSEVLHQIGMHFSEVEEAQVKVGFLFVVEAQSVSVVAGNSFSNERNF